METPPPLPQTSRVRPIRRMVFKKSLKLRFGDVSFDYGLIEASHEMAETWINENPGIEIVQIQTFHSSIHGITVVWYR